MRKARKALSGFIVTAMGRSSFEYELRKVFLKIRNIHARKLVPG
jgi:hypothetical protein